MKSSITCPNCEAGRLEWLEGGERGAGGYLCENWEKDEPETGCHRLLDAEEFQDVIKGLETRRSKKNICIEKNEDVSADGMVADHAASKDANVAALLRGDLVVRRQPLLPKVLSVRDAAAVVRKPFKCPCPGSDSSALSKELLFRISVLRKFVPWQSNGEKFKPLITVPSLLSGIEVDEAEETENEAKEAVEELPPHIEPLVLWQPEDDPVRASESSQPIIVDSRLTKFLRPHQREGVQFMFECVAGLRDFSKQEDGDEECCGCILADDMGLGKTLQSITLLYTLLCQGFDGTPMAKRALVVTPTSLVSNWESEIQKWLQGKLAVIALCESTRADVVAGINNFLAPRSPYQVLIISYETFRLHVGRLQDPDSCGLLICDEAHRLKNDRTLTNQALASLACRRRVLLSGTPMQNDLEEFFAMVNFTNPGILGSAHMFRKYFEAPILVGREPDATDEERQLATERSAELSENVNQFILRRTNALLSNHLPPKIVQVVCCKLSDLQAKLYRHFIHSKKVTQALADNAKRSKVLASITALKKLCNHPKLIYDTVRGGSSEAAGFEDCLQLFPAEMFSSRSGTWTGGDGSWVELSGKMHVLARLLAFLRQTTDDRIVLVSNYTQTLDLFSQICRERSYPFVRLDGTTTINKRQKLVERFNDPAQNEFAFLLSSKAGGCGLNLIGGNRLVLFDPDWNPATDKQAAARVWRDGQKKRVFIYRFLSTGTIEEKVFQRQMSKEGLQKVVDRDQSGDSRAQVNSLSSEDLRDLFTLREDVSSDTHETLSCQRCPDSTHDMTPVKSPPPPVGSPCHSTVAWEEAEEAASLLQLAAGEASDLPPSPPEATVARESLSSSPGFLNKSPSSVQAGARGENGREAAMEEGAGIAVAGDEVEDIGKFGEVAGVLDKHRSWHRQVGAPMEEDLNSWGHHDGTATVADVCLQRAAGDQVSFVFSCQVDGKLTPQESLAPGKAKPGGKFAAKSLSLAEPVKRLKISSSSSAPPARQGLLLQQRLQSPKLARWQQPRTQGMAVQPLHPSKGLSTRANFSAVTSAGRKVPGAAVAGQGQEHLNMEGGEKMAAQEVDGKENGNPGEAEQSHDGASSENSDAPANRAGKALQGNGRGGSLTGEKDDLLDMVDQGLLPAGRSRRGGTGGSVPQGTSNGNGKASPKCRTEVWARSYGTEGEKKVKPRRKGPDGGSVSSPIVPESDTDKEEVEEDDEEEDDEEEEYSESEDEAMSGCSY